MIVIQKNDFLSHVSQIYSNIQTLTHAEYKRSYSSSSFSPSSRRN